MEVFKIGTEVNNTLLCSDNAFLKVLRSVVNGQLGLGNIPQVVMDTYYQRGKHSGGKLVDIGNFSSISGEFKTLKEEIVAYQGKRISQLLLPYEGVSPYTDYLWRDYFLSSCLCYVEVFEKNTSKVEKFFATKNLNILETLAPIEDRQKYVKYVAPNLIDMQHSQIRVLKLRNVKNTYKITQPKSGLDFANKRILITPVFLLGVIGEHLLSSLETGIYKIRYTKDNNTERFLYTTLNPEKLEAVYGDRSQYLIGQTDKKYGRGYIRVPEYGGSKYDSTGVRAINLSRVIEIEKVEEGDVDLSYVNVDLDGVLLQMKIAVAECTDILQLVAWYQKVSEQCAPTMVLGELKNLINTLIDSNVAIGTTTYLRKLHRLMLDTPTLFTGYTGERSTEVNLFTNTFDAGVIRK